MVPVDSFLAATIAARSDRVQALLESQLGRIDALDAAIVADVLSSSGDERIRAVGGRFRDSLVTAAKPHGDVSRCLLQVLQAILAQPNDSTLIAELLTGVPAPRETQPVAVQCTPSALYVQLRAVSSSTPSPTTVRAVEAALRQCVNGLTGKVPENMPVALAIADAKRIGTELRSEAHAAVLRTLAPSEAAIAAFASGLASATAFEDAIEAFKRFEGARYEDHGAAALAVDLIALTRLQGALFAAPTRTRLEAFIEALGRFQEATRRLAPSRNEREFQDRLWVVVKSSFPDASDEKPAGEFAAVSNRPDFKCPSDRVLIDAKFIDAEDRRAELRRFREELADKFVSYLGPEKPWDTLLIVFFDAARLLAKYPEFVRDFNALKGVRVVVV